jgi:hypothetical protein
MDTSKGSYLGICVFIVLHQYFSYIQMVSVFDSSAADRGFEPRSGQ